MTDLQNEVYSKTGIDPDKAKELLLQREKMLNDSVVEPTIAPQQMQQRPMAQVTPIKPNIEIDENGYQSLGRIEPTAKPTTGGEMGWKNLPTDYLPSGGMFYPPNTLIQIRSASVREIRQFSTIDDRDMLGADDKIKYIIENCCRVKFDTKPGADYRDLLELDRLYILLSIRELTFSKGENKLQMTSTCDKCSHQNTVDIDKNHIKYFDLDERVRKYFNSVERCFTFTTDKGESFNLYLPTIGVNKFLTTYAKNQVQNNLQLDEAFLNFAPFIFPDWRTLNEKQYKTMSEKTYSWSIEMLSIVTGIIEVIRKGVTLDVQYLCKSCGSEVTAPLSFPDGTRSLFLYSDPFARLV